MLVAIATCKGMTKLAITHSTSSRPMQQVSTCLRRNQTRPHPGVSWRFKLILSCDGKSLVSATRPSNPPSRMIFYYRC